MNLLNFKNLACYYNTNAKSLSAILFPEDGDPAAHSFPASDRKNNKAESTGMTSS
jgi:hypothetical protein